MAQQGVTYQQAPGSGGGPPAPNPGGSTPRSFLVWCLGTAIVMYPFLSFVIFGWPGDVDLCINPTEDGAANSCYCEYFPTDVAESDAGGVRQPWNTWFNLYAIGTSLIVAWRLYADRFYLHQKSLVKSRSWIPDVYVFAVLFLGLGSMWFHASIKAWGGNFDGLSMYMYAAFLVWYTATKIAGHTLWFWIGYPLTVVAFTIVHTLWDWDLKSLILIIVLVAAYLALQVVAWVRDKGAPMNRWTPRLLWGGAVLCIGAATTFWVLSQTGEPLCFERSWFQPHGLLWHPLAGAMATLLYFYWREEPERVISGP